MRNLRRIQAGRLSAAGLRPYFAQVNRDIGNVEFVELFGGRNGVIFYGSDGYGTIKVMTARFIFWRRDLFHHRTHPIFPASSYKGSYSGAGSKPASVTF